MEEKEIDSPESEMTLGERRGSCSFTQCRLSQRPLAAGSFAACFTGTRAQTG